jgi:PhoH-like ATPase
LIDDGAMSGWVDNETNSELVAALFTPAMTTSVRPPAIGVALPRPIGRDVPTLRNAEQLREVSAPRAAAGASVPRALITSTVFVIDTSVLLADPLAMTRFAEHEVVLPLVVLMELEGKRHHPELGWAARRSLHLLEDLRTRHGTLIEPMPVNDEGGTLRVELNHQDLGALPPQLRADANDHRILSVALSLTGDGRDVVVVTKDLPLRLKAAVVGLAADEYRNELASDSGWTGFVELDVWGSVIDDLFEHRVVDLAEARDLPCHSGVALHSGSQSALARVHPDKRLHLVRADQAMFDLRGRSAEQHIAIDVLVDEEVGIVSLGGSAGTGKSVLALAAGLEAVLERRTHHRVVVFRPIYAVGGQDLGYLPGSETEKMSPWGAAVTDALEAMVGREVIEEVLDRGLLEILPLTHIRGRSLTDSFVIIDEAQNLERSVLLTALSRLGRGSRVVLTHDVAQRDNLRVGRHDGIVSVIESLKGHPLFAHVTLTRSERSAIAALVTQVLDG